MSLASSGASAIQEAVIVGHGWGGLAAWSTAVLEPRLSGPSSRCRCRTREPRRAVLPRDGHQRPALHYALGFQVPFYPERSLTARDGQLVRDLIAQWSHDSVVAG